MLPTRMTPAPAMGRRERVLATVRRQPVDRVPYVFWRYFPGADHSPAGLAQATLRFQERYGSDLLVIRPPAGYAARPWGGEDREAVEVDGTRASGRHPVSRPQDWSTVRTVEPAGAPGFADVLETIVRVGFDRRIADAPVLVALPSPLVVAARLAGEPRLVADTRKHPGAVATALVAVGETLTRFGELCLAEGLAGVVLEVAPALLGAAPYAEIAEPADRAVLGALRSRASLTVVHVSGPATAWEDLATWPADVWSWDERRGPPSLEAGLRRVPGAVMGGLDAWQTLRMGSPADAAEAARRAVERTGGRGLLVAPGGPVMPETPDPTLVAVIRALGGQATPILGVAR